VPALQVADVDFNVIAICSAISKVLPAYRCWPFRDVADGYTIGDLVQQQALPAKQKRG
jgi:hypothetical protein